MKLLIVLPYVPSLIRVRPYQLIRGLVEQGHEVTLATVWATDEERADLDKVSSYCSAILAHRLTQAGSLLNAVRALMQPWPLQAAYAWHSALEADIVRVLNEQPFDIVHVEHIRGAQYGLAAHAALARAGLSTPVIWDSVDCISHLFEQAKQLSRGIKGRLLSGLDLGRTRRFEGYLVELFDRVLVTSHVDKQALMSLADRVAPSVLARLGSPVSTVADKLEVLTNGVDLNYFRPDRTRREPNKIVFSGKMSYHANSTAALHLVREIMPYVWSQRPDAEVWLVGKEPSREIKALDTCGHGSRRVVVTGTVPDIRPHLRSAAIAAAPIVYGAGIQNKLLEAMACATPVVTMSQGVGAFQARPVRGVMVADKPRDFADALLGLLDDPARREALGQEGRAFVERNHAWPAIAGALVSIYHKSIAIKQGLPHAA